MIVTETFDVGTSEAVLVVPALHTAQDVRLHNHEHGQSHFVFVGDSAVGTANGFDVAAESYLSLMIPAGEELWAISNHDTVEFHVMRVAK